jgi:hypothetical protein
MCWNGQGTKGTQMNDTSIVPELYLLVQEVASFECSSVNWHQKDSPLRKIGTNPKQHKRKGWRKGWKRDVLLWFVDEIWASILEK